MMTTLQINQGGTGVTTLPALINLVGGGGVSDEIRIRPEDVPQDYTTDAQPFIQAKLNEAQALGKRLILPALGNRYLTFNAPLVATPGAQRASTTAGIPSGAIKKDASGVALRNNVRIEGNGCTIVPKFSGFALDVLPTMTIAEMADPNNGGFDSAQLDIRNLNFNLNAAPGAQAMRIGRQGRSFHDLTFYSQIHGISVNAVGGDNTAPVDHGIRFEGYLYAIEATGWRLNAIGGGLWMVIDGTSPGCFQGAFFFKDFQSLGTMAKRPLRVSVLAGTTGARSEIRGLHFQDSQIYGAGTYFEAVGNANIGDIWWHPGCQWDPAGGTVPGTGEPVIQITAANGGKIFNNYWSQPYIQGFNGPACRITTDGNGVSIVSNQQFFGGDITSINNPPGGIFDMQGLHAGGLVLNGLDFQGCTGTAYVVMNNADSLAMNNCTSHGETVGDSNVTDMIATAGTIRRISALGNMVRCTGDKTTLVRGAAATAQLVPNASNFMY